MSTGKEQSDATTNTILLLIVFITLIVGACIIIFGFLVRDNNENLGIEYEIEDTRSNLERCVEDAYDVHESNWNSTCEIRGKEKDCILNHTDAEKLSQRYQRQLDRCYYRF